jgi:immune inhibitor A
MKGKLSLTLAVSLALLASLFFVFSAAATPPAPDAHGAAFVGPVDLTAPKVAPVKPFDQPNIKDYARNQERMRLLAAGQVAEANALALTGTDRVLVILVEFAGTDVFTWTQGVSQWDPYGRADPNELGPGGAGDCSRIITETKVFTYTGPLHNQIPRPLSAADRSGDSIWTEDFSNDWFKNFMWGNGVTFHYTRTDGSLVHEDFTGKSVNHYFMDLSNGQYQITGDVIGWVQVPHSTWYYDADQCPGARSGASVQRGGMIPGAGNTRTLVRDALDRVNAISNTIAGFDWKNYDKDGDGIIDRLWIVHSGYGEEDSPTLLNRTDYSEAAVWSHSSSVVPPYQVAPGVAAGPYIVMPENGGIGVFAHEYAHNLGAMDLYAYDLGETSAGFWALQADDWTGYPIGYEPPAPDPMHLDWWGWLQPKTIIDPNQSYVVTVGQASEFPGNNPTAGAADANNLYRGVKIVLPNGNAPLPVRPWQGSYYWWGGKVDLANAAMTTKNPIALTGGTTAILTFETAYGIEAGWDFMWVQVSTDGGATWKTMTNTHTTCVHDPSWIGELYGFPADLCGAGLGGLTGYNIAFPGAGTETFDLTPYIGQNVLLRFWYMTDWGTTNEGPFVDNIQVMVGGAVKFADNAEAGDANWNYAAPWQRTAGAQSFTHNYYLQWRNVSPTGGYDSALGDARWRYGPANTGLLVWYNNNFYNDNEVWHYLSDFPSWGAKGKMLVVDANNDPYREPAMVAAGYNNEAGNIIHRGSMRDAPFSLKQSVPFVMNNTYPYSSTIFTSAFASRPAVSTFYDGRGYYPGAEYISRGPGYNPPSMRWVTKQWDASVVLPATGAYPLRAPGYVGTSGTTANEFRFNCASRTDGLLGCYWYGGGVGLGYNGGTGNPGDYGVAYGWRVQILSQTEQTATLRIWNARYLGEISPDKTVVGRGSTITYKYQLPKNQGAPMNLFACVPLDPTKLAYVANSVTNGALALSQTCDELGSALASGQNLPQVSVTAADPIRSIAWTAYVARDADASFSFAARTMLTVGVIDDVAVQFYRDGVRWDVAHNLPATPVRILGPYGQYLPLAIKP